MNVWNVRTAALAILVVFGSTACGTAGKRTAIGGGAGALLGATMGALAGGKKGAVIGAGVGALAGGSVGLYLDKQAKELAAVAETKRTEDGILVEMKNDILFDTGSSDLKPEAVTQLGKVGDIMAKYSDNRVRIEGHTDASGSDDFNQKLSERRAASVQTVLVTRGVQAAQITAIGLGENKPIAGNDTADGRSKNRRVQVHIDVPNPSAAPAS
jgi:outer membrane protein OmpA-like peptidoglycan-associated protein